MCGICGIIARKGMGLSHKHLELFEQMLVINTIRGKDATGAMTGFRNKEARVVKIGTNPFNLFRTDAWTKFKSDAINRGRFVIGHNRAKTIGEASSENAHPFVENHIILVHNGTLMNHTKLTTEKVEVDSHAIAHALAVDTPENVIPTIDGAFALVWYNTETERLYAVRNKERPLSLLYTDDAYMVSSEPWIAAMPTSRSNIKIDDIQDIEPGKLYEFDFLGNIKITQVELKPEKVYKNQGVFVGNARDEWEGYGEPHSFFRTGERETPPEIKSLQQALTTPSKDCVIESGGVCQASLKSIAGLANRTKSKQQENSTTRPVALLTASGTDGRTPQPANSSEEEKAEAAQGHIKISDPEFVRGEPLLIKIWETTQTPTGRYRFAGKVMQPDKSMADITGFLPQAVTNASLHLWISENLQADVMFVTVTVGGRSIFVHKVRRVEYVPVHATDGGIPKPLWEHVQANCHCDKCGREVEEWERVFTRVTMKSIIGSGEPKNTPTILCADCVSDKVQGEFGEGYKARYNNAKKAIENQRASQERIAHLSPSVQNRESVGAEPVGKNGSVIVVPGAQTVH